MSTRLLPPGTRVVRTSGLAFLIHGPAAALAVVLGLLAITVTLVSLTLGDFDMTVIDAASAVAGHGSPILTHVVVDMRLPRALTALGVGGALAVSGHLLQQLARNPLVSPDVIGINAGASAAAVLTIVVIGGSTLLIAAGALVGAVTVALALYTLAYRRGVTGYRLVLIGIAVSAILGSATSYLLTRTDIRQAQRAMVWLAGSLGNREWPHVTVIAVALLVLVPMAVLLARQLRLLQLGDEAATTLGGRVQWVRAGLLFVSAALAAFATSVAGPVGFVALVAPQIVRRLLGNRPGGLAAAMACGALLVTSADLIGRTLFGGVEMPVGVITGILGAPYLLYLLARGNRMGQGS